jgi:hypothetical protein
MSDSNNSNGMEGVMGPKETIEQSIKVLKALFERTEEGEVIGAQLAAAICRAQEMTHQEREFRVHGVHSPIGAEMTKDQWTSLWTLSSHLRRVMVAQIRASMPKQEMTASEKLTRAIDELMRIEAQHRRLNNLETLLQVEGAKQKVLNLTEQSRQERRLS